MWYSLSPSTPVRVLPYSGPGSTIHPWIDRQRQRAPLGHKEYLSHTTLGRGQPSRPHWSPNAGGSLNEPTFKDDIRSFISPDLRASSHGR